MNTLATTDVVLIACCPVHGLHGERTECHVCGGPVDQVPMVPVVDPQRGPCACGCGHPKRPKSDYASDACKTREWKRRTGYVDPRRSSAANGANGAQTRLLRTPRPGGRQISYGVAVQTLARYLVQAQIAADAEQARAVAERVLTRALPARQRTRARRRR